MNARTMAEQPLQNPPLSSHPTCVASPLCLRTWPWRQWRLHLLQHFIYVTGDTPPASPAPCRDSDAMRDGGMLRDRRRADFAFAVGGHDGAIKEKEKERAGGVAVREVCEGQGECGGSCIMGQRACFTSTNAGFPRDDQWRQRLQTQP